MSQLYDDYLREHVTNVGKAWVWMRDNVPVSPVLETEVENLVRMHDMSKTKRDEYRAYDDYFYGGNRSTRVVRDFHKAWLKHIHRNPHHWQHWVLIHDDEPMEALEMPPEYIYEMIADWWSFSFKSGNLREIFSWYEKHNPGMILHPKTKNLVESILGQIKEKLDKEETGHEQA